MKRIALIGNMNNNFFALTRYLRDKGYDAHLFYRLAMEHFQPLADSYVEDYLEYCHCVDWLNNGFHNVEIEKVKRELDGFDFYIGQGEEAAVAYYCGFRMDVYYPYGSDIYKYAHLPHEYGFLSKFSSLLNSKNRPSFRRMQAGTMAKYLSGVISTAKFVFADATNDEYQQMLNTLGCRGVFKHVGIPFIYVPEYEKLHTGYKPESKYAGAVDAIRGDNEFILLYHGRQEWHTYHNKFTGKNTHHLIKGFAKYIKTHPTSKICLVMLEYGSDVEASKELVNKLEISQYVYWLPKMYRKELMYLVMNADACCGEFAHSFLTFGTVVEAMLMKKPIITYREDDYYLPHYSELYPCYNAREPEEIKQAINDAFINVNKRKYMGEAGYQWINKYFINTPLQELINVIEQ